MRWTNSFEWEAGGSFGSVRSAISAAPDTHVFAIAVIESVIPPIDLDTPTPRSGVALAGKIIKPDADVGAVADQMIASGARSVLVFAG